MSTDSFHDVLRQARQLSAEQQRKLIDALAGGTAVDIRPEQASLGDRMQARGLLGVARGPHDLSTNPRHMEGFGEHGT